MFEDVQPPDEIELVARRADLLELLTDRRLSKREIVDELGHSRSTVNRAINRLTAAGLVDETTDGCRTTLGGRLALEQYWQYVSQSVDVLTAEKALSVLPTDVEMPVGAITGSQVYTAGGDRPYEPYEAVYDVFDRSQGVRACLRTISNRRSVETILGNASEIHPFEVVFSADLFRLMYADWQGLVESLADIETFRGFVSDDPLPFAIVLANQQSGDDRQKTEVALVTYSEDNELGGVIINDDPTAVVWARDQYRNCRQNARPMREAMVGRQ